MLGFAGINLFIGYSPFMGMEPLTRDAPSIPAQALSPICVQPFMELSYGLFYAIYPFTVK
jgi:hypothetical protein